MHSADSAAFLRSSHNASVLSPLASAIMEANGTEQLLPVKPVQSGMDTLILNGDAAEREEADPAKKKKKKKKKSKSAVSGECLIHSSKCRDPAITLALLL